jgi:hypothetical protein
MRGDRTRGSQDRTVWAKPGVQPEPPWDRHRKLHIARWAIPLQSLQPCLPNILSGSNNGPGYWEISAPRSGLAERRTRRLGAGRPALVRNGAGSGRTDYRIRRSPCPWITSDPLNSNAPIAPSERRLGMLIRWSDGDGEPKAEPPQLRSNTHHRLLRVGARRLAASLQSSSSKEPWSNKGGFRGLKESARARVAKSLSPATSRRIIGPIFPR